jgi:hypothetical protein
MKWCRDMPTSRGPTIAQYTVHVRWVDPQPEHPRKAGPGYHFAGLGWALSACRVPAPTAL